MVSGTVDPGAGHHDHLVAATATATSEHAVDPVRFAAGRAPTDPATRPLRVLSRMASNVTAALTAVRRTSAVKVA